LTGYRQLFREGVYTAPEEAEAEVLASLIQTSSLFAQRRSGGLVGELEAAFGLRRRRPSKRRGV
jgi:hypothetical protein